MLISLKILSAGIKGDMHIEIFNCTQGQQILINLLNTDWQTIVIDSCRQDFLEENKEKSKKCASILA